METYYRLKGPRDHCIEYNESKTIEIITIMSKAAGFYDVDLV